MKWEIYLYTFLHHTSILLWKHIILLRFQVTYIWGKKPSWYIYGFCISPPFEHCFIKVFSLLRICRISMPAISDVIWVPISLFLTLNLPIKSKIYDSILNLNFQLPGAWFSKNRQKSLSADAKSFLRVGWCCKLYQKIH